MLTKDEAIAGLQASHRDFMSRLDAVSSQDAAWITHLPTGTWRVRDVAAHVAAWDAILAADIGALPQGRVPAWLTWDDATTDEANESQVRERASLSVEQLRDELVAGRAALVEAVAALDAAEFGRTHRAGDAETSAAGLCEYWIGHDREHTAELSAVAQASGPA